MARNGERKNSGLGEKMEGCCCGVVVVWIRDTLFHDGTNQVKGIVLVYLEGARVHHLLLGLLSSFALLILHCTTHWTNATQEEAKQNRKSQRGKKKSETLEGNILGMGCLPGDFLPAPAMFFIHPAVREKNRKYPSLNLHIHLLPFHTIHATVSPSPPSHHVVFIDSPLLFMDPFTSSIHPSSICLPSSSRPPSSHSHNNGHRPALAANRHKFFSSYSTYTDWKSVMPIQSVWTIRIVNPYGLYWLSICIAQ